jgi:hypothetical protein
MYYVMQHIEDIVIAVVNLSALRGNKNQEWRRNADTAEF